MRRLLARPLGITALALAFLVSLGVAAQTAPPNDVTKAEFYLKKLEDHARRARGAAFKPGYEDNEALKRIKELKEKHPEDPAVEALFARARAALMGSKGDFIEITPEMLRYRDQEKKIVELFSKEANAQIAAWKAKASAGGKLLAQPLPAPGIREPGASGMPGKYVVLDEVEYPANQFTDLGREYVSWGTPARGLYYVQIDTPAWRGAYEALKRYRRLVNAGLAEGTPITVAGRVESAELTVPEAGKKRLGGAFWGWVVVPEAIWVDGLAFAVADRSAELGGRFAGEERMEQIKGPLYSVRSIPADVTPERLVEIFATAIQEKNLKLYLDCIDPKRLEGPRAKPRDVPLGLAPGEVPRLLRPHDGREGREDDGEGVRRRERPRVVLPDGRAEGAGQEDQRAVGGTGDRHDEGVGRARAAVRVAEAARADPARRRALVRLRLRRPVLRRER